MHVLFLAKQQVLRELKNAIGKEYSPSLDDLGVPPDQKLGDVAFPCFVLAKALKRNPAELASELAAKIGPKEYIKQVTAKGPYVNFLFNEATFGKDVLETIQKQKEVYGSSDMGEGKRIMVEYAQPNTHKSIHVGHLRNFTVGQMTVDVLKVNGYDVIPTTYINDLGMHVALCLWGLEKMEVDLSEKGRTLREKMDLLGEAYTHASKLVAEDPQKKEEVSALFQDLEQLKGDQVGLWKKTRKWSLEYMKAVFEEMGVVPREWYYESALLKDTRKIIDDLVQRGIVVHSEGAWIVDLQGEDLGVNLLVKSDGTLLYNAKDLALALKKEEDHHPQRSVYVIDARQSLAMQQLFATLKRMGFQKDLSHLSYEFVTLKDGAMASRKGNVVRYEEFRDELIESAYNETKERHADWSEKKVSQVARAVAFAALRFTMLKQDLDKKIVFDRDEALSFEGFTGPYLLYSYSRIKSIERKAGRVRKKIQTAHLQSSVEHRLLILLSEYPSVIMSVAKDFSLNRVAQYLFELAKTFSEFYDQVPVLQAENKEMLATRLALVRAVAQVLENGMRLMRIETVEEM